MPRRRYQDPLTHDEIGLRDYISIRIQVVMRAYWFLFAYSAVIWAAFFLGRLLHDPTHATLNLILSWQALVFEQLIGIGMMSWARRDSAVIRRVEGVVNRLEALEQATQRRDEKADQTLANQITMLEALLSLQGEDDE